VLLAAGAEVYITTDDGRSLLMIGSYLQPEATALLLRSGLRANDDAILSAVHSGNAQVVAMLLAAGANPAARESDGRSALELARAIQQSHPGPLGPGFPYRQDHAGVVTLLERALAKR